MQLAVMVCVRAVRKLFAKLPATGVQNMKDSVHPALTHVKPKMRRERDGGWRPSALTLPGLRLPLTTAIEPGPPSG